MSSAAPAVKAALFAGFTTLFAGEALVTYGQPGPYQPDDIVAIENMRSNNEAEPNSTARTFNEVIEVDFTVSVYRGGGVEVQQTATERAYTLLAMAERCLTATAPSLGGMVSTTAGVGSHDLAEAATEQGRIAEIGATARLQASI